VNERTGLLRQSEVRLIDALDAVSDGFWEWSIPTGEVYYSPQWIRILGYSPADVPARVEFFFGIVHPDDVGRAQTAIDDHLAGRTQLKHLDIRLRRKSGEYLLVSDRGRIVAWDQHGTPVRMVGSITDVSSQRRAEDKLREDVLLADFSAAIGTCLTSGENLRAALQGCCEAMTAILGAASARIWTLDPAQGFLNLQALSGDPGTLETGRSRVPLGSLGIGMIAQSSQPHIAASIENDIWIGESEWAAKEGMITFAGYPLLVEGRTVGVAELYGRRLFTPAAFQTLNTATNVIAISIHRDQARRQLRESDEKIHHVLAGALDAIVTMDAQGRITGWNPRAESIFGWSAAEAIDRRLADLIIPPAAREGHGRGLRRFLQTGQTHMLNRVLELTAIRRDGSEFPVELVVASFTSQGEQHFSSFIRDITDRKQLESQVLRARKMDGLGQLAGGIAHDFNDLLIVINGAAQRGEINLAQGRSTRDDLAAIRTAASQASSLTQRILAFSRNQTLQPATVDFNRLIHQVAAMLQRLIGEQIEVSLDLDPELCRVTIDSAQFEQVIVNLAINSRDAMPEGGRLTLQTRNLLLAENDLKLYPSLQPGHHAQLSVVDTGLGMDEATRQSVFEPFFTTKPPGQGTGLGLSMAYGVVCQSDGDIRVSSTPGSGTTVTILLPRAFGEPLQFPIAPQPALRRGAETILVVEDDAAVRTLAARFLTAAGYCVHTAAHGPEALHLLKGLSGAVDLVLTDLAMPEMDGHTLATHIRTSHPGVRLIFTSGYLREDLEPEVAFLQKPYDLLDLAAKIRKTLDA
jgi:PAS domain S-box-containing protein